MVTIEERLEKTGFKAASKRVTELRERKRKLMIAYENYRFVRQEKIDAFNTKLGKEKSKDGSWKMLDFAPIESYEGAPPESVLDALETAQGRNCFDTFEVAYIRQVRDPILFGRIKACPDRFFIAQWDDDVKIEDILKPNEG